MSKVSLVLPMYNGHEHTNHMLDQLNTQTFTNFSVILVDDGSEIPFKIDKNYNYPITLCQYSKNKGCSTAINIGTSLSLGEPSDIVGFINNDVDISSNLIEKLVENLLESPSDVKVVCPYFEGVAKKFLNSQESIYGFQALCWLTFKSIYLERYIEEGYFFDPAYRYGDSEDLDFMQWLVIKGYSSKIIKNCYTLNNKQFSTSKIPDNLKQKNRDYYNNKWSDPSAHNKLFK